MTALKNIYCISGLGADHRIFEHLTLPSGFRLSHIPWISPGQEERIESYARRMAKQIRDPEPLLIGVSFGGMLSVEISKFLPVKKIILISSIKTNSEKPFYFRVAKNLRLNKMMNLKPYRFLEPIENYTLGAKSAEEKALAREYRENLNLNFSNWAIDQILHWQNDQYPKNIVHIHGSDDHVFPIRYVRPTNIIKDGGHLMIMDKADEVSQIIEQILT